MILAVLLTCVSAVGIAWRPWPVLVAAAVAVGIAVRMPNSGTPSGSRVLRCDWPAAAAAGVCVVVAGAAWIQFASGAATSADLSYVWGAKAVHFASAGGMDFGWMKLPHLIHLHPNYPPLWPVSLAWGAMISGSMPWALVPVITLGCLIAAGLVIHSLLRRPLGAHGAALVTSLWFAVLAGSTLRSFSGGSAEGPLLLFVTVAVTVLLVEDRTEAPSLRWLAAGALAGAVLTKSEGAVATGLIVAGTAIRDGVWHRHRAVKSSIYLALPALAAAGLWAAIRIANGLPLNDPIRETAFHISFEHLQLVLKICIRLAGTGVLAVGWLVPLLAVPMARPKDPLRVLSGLAVAGGLPLFAVFYYLHAVGDPLELIVWTFPRLIQPAISAWIVCLGILCFSRRPNTRESTG